MWCLHYGHETEMAWVVALGHPTIALYIEYNKQSIITAWQIKWTAEDELCHPY